MLREINFLCFAIGIFINPIIVRAQSESTSKNTAVEENAVRRSKQAKKINQAKSAQYNKYADDRLREGYQPLTNLDATSSGGKAAFTLGAIPPTKPGHVYDFGTTDDASLEQQISQADDLLAIDKQNPRLYARRGYLKGQHGDIQAAIKDADRAIELDPKTVSYRWLRGWLKMKQNDADGALTECNQALELVPDDVDVLLLRAQVKRRLKLDHEGSLQDAKRAVELAPSMPDARLSCGEAYLSVWNWQEAQTQYREYCGLVEAKQAYPRYFIWITQIRLHQKEAAGAELTEYLAKLSPAASTLWSNVIGEFLAGSLSEADLLAKAVSSEPKKDSQQHCEAWYYAGMKHLFADEKDVAVEDFHRCLSTQETRFVEYNLARIELASLAP